MYLYVHRWIKCIFIFLTWMKWRGSQRLLWDHHACDGFETWNTEHHRAVWKHVGCEPRAVGWGRRLRSACGTGAPRRPHHQVIFRQVHIWDALLKFLSLKVICDHTGMSISLTKSELYVCIHYLKQLSFSAVSTVLVLPCIHTIVLEEVMFVSLVWSIDLFHILSIASTLPSEKHWLNQWER